MSKDDDDLRFGDVDHEKDNQESDSGGSISAGGFDIIPPAVGGVIAVYLLIVQPLSGSISGFSMNIVFGLAIAAGGVIAAFDD
ncbi:MAG: hypothetical protein A07HR60_01871 [uncultured archaeon A07HR60]|jgi:hypothetical protein|nr:MAG: hypothetical protein A07HR60_01871 [uncultured archaeon A07HR60]